ncbi:MAG: LamG domain-containing protein, partial [Anaerohalosphaera sp.]|nr:LamG domain-containing protein [Anaerohalosphaera sp.]
LSGISYDVYLAKDGEALALLGNVETNSFTPASPLTDPNTVYNWRIDSISDGRTSAGDVWSLRTGGILSNFSPANGSGGISALPTLSWIGDSTGSYIDEVDIYMGDSPGSLALIATVTELSYQVLTELPEATTKYWQAVPKHGGVEIPGSASQVLSFTTGNLLAHWPMGTTDDVVSGLTTTIVKKTTEAADPTVIPGIVGDATLFAGDACYALDSASLWDNTGNGLAISAWVKWDMMSDDTDRGLMWSPFVTRSNGPEGSNGWSLQLYKYYFRPQLRTGSENMTAGEMYDFESVWHHIVAVYAPSGRQMWIDGVLVREYDGVAPFGLVDAPVSIGGRVTDADVLENGFIGAIDEVYVYDRIVSEPEALDLYKISPMAKLPDPAHGETGVAYDEQLTWVPGTTGGIAKQTLSYGMAPDLSDATVVTDLAADASSFTLPGNMELGENYFWKVDSIASDDSVIWEGPIWSFAVMELVGDIVVNKIVDIDDLKAVAAEWTDNSRSIPSVAMLPWAEPLTVGNIDNYLYSAAGYYQKSWWELGTPETDPNGFFTPVSDVSAVWHFDYPGTPWSTGGEIYGGFDLPEPISLENVNMVTFWVRPVNVPDADYYHPPAWLQGYCNDGAANFAWPLLQPKDPETGELIGWTEASAANDGTGKWVKMEWWTGSHSQTFGGIGFWTNWSGTNPQQPAHFEFGDIELTYANGLDPVCWIGSDLSDADFNKDCDVDLYDFAIFAGNWLVDAN